MKIAVEGCAHGELEIIYETISYIENRDNIKIDLLICCGDFQASRNEEDLRCMAVPPKYYNICSFYKYYSGEKKAPVLTIFVGGNHEASNYLQELPYGGWVAPNIYYMGYASVINIGGLRIGGISGIYKDRDYMKGRFEVCPYDEGTKRSVYHVRNLDVFRLKQLSQSVDIFISHDWPNGITNYGNKSQLVKFKPHFKEDIEAGKLGSKPSEELLFELKPKYWFAAHLHCKFSAVVPHSNRKMTKFLALDKCLPKRRYLQILDVDHDPNETLDIRYDLEWLTVLRLTNHLISVKNVTNYMPTSLGNDRCDFTPTIEQMESTRSRLCNELTVPKNFQMTAPSYIPNATGKQHIIRQPQPTANPQTTTFCETIGVDDPLSLILILNEPRNIDVLNQSFNNTFNNTTFISDTDADISTEHSAGSPRKRSSLILPEPKVALSDSFIVDNCDKVGQSELQNSTSGSECFITAEETEDVQLQGSSEATMKSKTFKRRNADLYKFDT